MGRHCRAERQGIARILEALQAHAWSGLHRKAPPPVGRALRTAAAPPLRMPAVDRDGDSPAGQRTGNGAASAAEPAAANGFLEGPDVLSFREFLSSNDAAIGGAKLDDEDEGEERFDQLMASFAGDLLPQQHCECLCWLRTIAHFAIQLPSQHMMLH